MSKDWTIYEKIWINPPFTKKFDFLKKAVETYKANNNIQIYVLTTTESLCTKKFKDITEGISYKIYMPSGRINFESGLGKVTRSPAFSTVIIKFECVRSVEVVDVNLLKPKKGNK